MNEDMYIYDIEKMLKFDDLIVYQIGVFDSKLISTPISEKSEKAKKRQLVELLPKLNVAKGKKVHNNASGYSETERLTLLKPGKTLKLLLSIETASSIGSKSS